MSYQRLDGTSQSVGRDLSGGRRLSVVIRRLGLLASLAIVLVLAAGSVAGAASFNWYWYNGNLENCWQTGQLGSEGKSCDYVFTNYLQTHMFNDTEGGISKDFKLSGGDHCSYYGEGDNLESQIAGNQGSATGYTTPEPFSSYQEGDANGSVCQANGDHWGQEVRGGVSGYSCPVGGKLPCGMHLYASAGGNNNRPWSSAFGEPALVLSAEADAQTFNHSGEYYGGWAYVCPELEDVAQGAIIEYCFEEWRSSHDASAWKTERKGECNSPFTQVITLFASGTTLATEMSGSANTTESTGNAHYEAKITAANLANAAKLINAECKWALSTEAKDYALIGVEQGLEGWDGLTELAGNSNNLHLHTEYTPLPPEATTTAATEVQQFKAKLTGTVNPRGTETHYHFEYGKTTSYGSRTEPEGNAGSGQGSVGASATVTGLEAGTTYHYRLVATSGEGRTAYGADQELRTEVTATPALLLHSNGEGSVFYRGANSQLYWWLWNGEKWALNWMSEAPAMAGNPATVLTSQGYQEIFYRDTNGRLDYWDWNGSKWSLDWLGESGAMGGEPVALLHPSTGEQEIFYRGTNGQLYYWVWNGEKWGLYWMSGAPAMAGNPTPVLTSQGYQEIFYRDTSGRLDYWWWNGEKWTLEWLGESGAMGGEPVAVLHSNGEQEVYYGSATGVLDFRYWNNVEWSLQWLGSAGAL